MSKELEEATLDAAGTLERVFGSGAPLALTVRVSCRFEKTHFHQKPGIEAYESVGCYDFESTDRDRAVFP